MDPQALSLEIRRLQQRQRVLLKAARRNAMALDVGVHFGEQPPEALLRPYSDEVLGALAKTGVQRKYLDRPSNIRRSWNRAHFYTPELTVPGPSKRILELSTAHGAMLEVYRHFGHQVIGNDFANFVGTGDDSTNFRQLDEEVKREVDDFGIRASEDGKFADWPYRPLTEAIGLPMSIFDAGRTPYPFEDKSQEYLLTFQAMEHYCHPGDWRKLLDEFCRIATTGVVVMLNPLHPHLSGREGYKEAFENARHMLRGYNANGFRCVAVQLAWSQALGFKLMAV